ncbi:hypothetical protein CR513_31001, partial [Mucuna pruriens]
MPTPLRLRLLSSSRLSGSIQQASFVARFSHLEFRKLCGPLREDCPMKVDWLKGRLVVKSLKQSPRAWFY